MLLSNACLVDISIIFIREVNVCILELMMRGRMWAQQVGNCLTSFCTVLIKLVGLIHLVCTLYLFNTSYRCIKIGKLLLAL